MADFILATVFTIITAIALFKNEDKIEFWPEEKEVTRK